MKSITIHGLEPQLEKGLRKKAEEMGLSLSKTIKLLLRDAMGLQKNEKSRKDEFMDLSGVWSKEDEQEFLKNISDCQVIDERDWK